MYKLNISKEAAKEMAKLEENDDISAGKEFFTYREMVLKTWSGITGKEALSNAVLGLCGESGEVADLVKKHVFHGHDLDKEKMVKELGDVLYYAEVLMHELNVTRQEVEEKNIEKLAKRYPAGFSVEASKNRKE